MSVSAILKLRKLQLPLDRLEARLFTRRIEPRSPQVPAVRGLVLQTYTAPVEASEACTRAAGYSKPRVRLAGPRGWTHTWVEMDFPGFHGHLNGRSRERQGVAMSRKFSSGRTREVYEFIKAHRHEHDVWLMCRVLEVAPSGYYAWLKNPQSRRSAENARLLDRKSVV